MNANAKKLLSDMQKRFGDHKIMMASDIPVGPAISTGSLGLDFATEYGGLPINRVVEFYGQEGTGKTTLALLTMMNALAKYPRKSAMFLDVEHKLTKEWLEMIVGKELLAERVLYMQPTSIEEATNMYRQAVESGTVCCAILDSIGGAPTVRRNEDAEVGHYGGNSIGVGEFARAAATHASIYNCLTIGINQTRANMGMGYSDQTPGGRAWRHACVLRIELARGKDTITIKLPGEEKPFPVGHVIYGKIRKNQVGPEGRTAMWWFHNVWTEEWGFGVDRLDEISRLGLKTRVLTLSGSWYSHPAFPANAKGEHKVQGLNKVKELIRDDEAIAATLTSEILAKLGDYAQEVAPLSDPEAPIEVGSMLLDGANA